MVQDTKFKILVILVAFFSFGFCFEEFESFKFQEHSAVSRSGVVNDEDCDRQLMAFAVALSKPEIWALQSKKFIEYFMNKSDSNIFGVIFSV